METNNKMVNEEGLELEEKVVMINRVAKVVKGGRRFSFNVLAVVGDGSGHVGVGFGKANEVPDAIRKSVEDAKKNMCEIKLSKNTIPHEIIGKFKSAKVVLRPASPGTGIIAGASVRAVVERVGISDILAKSLGSRNPLNIVKATMNGLAKLRNLKEAAELREVTIKKLMG